MAAILGEQLRSARVRRKLSQVKLGESVGLTGARVGQIEAGDGTGVGLEVWLAFGQTLGIAFNAGFQRDPRAAPQDAGHLAIQELALRLARETHRPRTFELATRPLETGHSVDVFVRDDRLRTLFIEECWNTFGNVNASVRSTRRKIAEAEQLAVAAGGDRGPYRVAAVWIVRDTRANRELLERYPEVFATTFAGSSKQWVRALTTEAHEAPADPGLLWCDRQATRVFAWRKRL